MNTSITKTAVLYWISTIVYLKVKLPAAEAEWSVISPIPSSRTFRDCQLWRLVIRRSVYRPAVPLSPAHRAKIARAKPSGWALTLVNGGGCTIWTTPWMNCGVSFRTPIRHRFVNCQKSPLSYWPKITSWCKPMRWTNSDESSPTWTKRQDCPFRRPLHPWWPIHRVAIWLAVATAARRRWELIRHPLVHCHLLRKLSVVE